MSKYINTINAETIALNLYTETVNDLNAELGMAHPHYNAIADAVTSAVIISAYGYNKLALRIIRKIYRILPSVNMDSFKWYFPEQYEILVSLNS